MILNYLSSPLFLASILITPALSLADTQLQNNTPLTNLSGSRGSETHYHINVPAGASNLVIETSGGRGDADLYVDYEVVPTRRNYDCRPYRWGNNESCEFGTVDEGIYHIMIRGYSRYSDMTLVASYEQDDGSDGENPPVGDCELTNTQQALLDAINTARSQGRTCGSTWYPDSPALTWDCRLASAATRHSIDMAENNFFSHTGSDGSRVSDRVRDEEYLYRRVGENIAAGYSSVSHVVDGWLGSSGHCANIMNRNYQDLGADKISEADSRYRHYWTTVFGAE